MYLNKKRIHAQNNMGVPFSDIDPYAVLGVSKESNYIEIKRAYKKLCLKLHPDKSQYLSEGEADPEAFPKLQFAYSILNDPSKRQRYDIYGTIDDSLASEEFFDWKEYFQSMNESITFEMIEEDKLKYQNSKEEKDDIIKDFIYHDGDILKLFEVIPHLEFDETQENRVFGIIEGAMSDEKFRRSLDSSTIDSWNKYKKSRKTKVRQMLKKLAKEAKEAEKLEKELNIKNKRGANSEDELKSLIQNKNNRTLSDLINKLESKYVNNKGAKRSHMDISEEEFEKTRKRITKASAKKQKKSA